MAPNHLSVAEIAALREIFQQFDSNGDGVIERSEFATLLAALESDLQGDEIDIALAELDRNANGVIEFQEFLNWWAEQ